MKSYTATPRFVTPKDAFDLAIAHGQAVFRFRDAIRVTNGTSVWFWRGWRAPLPVRCGMRSIPILATLSPGPSGRPTLP